MKKKARDAGLISWCHLNNIMSDSIFHKAGDNMFCFVLFFVLLLLFFFFFPFRLFKVSFFYGVILLFSVEWKTCNQFYHYNISGLGKILNYKRLRQMELISLQWDLKISGFQTRDLIMGFLCLCMLCYFWPAILRFYSIQPTWGLVQMDSNKILDLSNSIINVSVPRTLCCLRWYVGVFSTFKECFITNFLTYLAFFCFSYIGNFLTNIL